MLSREYNNNTVLVNFRMPVSLKDSFDTIVKFKSSNRSKTLIDLMKGYVDSEHTEVKQQVDNQMDTINLFRR